MIKPGDISPLEVVLEKVSPKVIFLKCSLKYTLEVLIIAIGLDNGQKS